MMPLWASVLLAVVPILVSGATLFYTIHKDNVNKSRQQEIEERQNELQKRQSDVEAIAQYRQVKAIERDYKKDMIAMTNGLNKNPNEAEVFFLSAYSSFTDLFNEANAFCSLINHNDVVAKEVLKNTGIDLLLKLADYQCEGYKVLKQAAEKIGTSKVTMKRPDINAFREYDDFLKKRMPKARWETLIQKRKDVALMF